MTDTREQMQARVAAELPRLLAEIYRSQGVGLMGVDWTADDVFEAVLEELNTDPVLMKSIEEFNKTRANPVHRYGRAPVNKIAAE